MSIGTFDTANITKNTTIALWVFAIVTVALAVWSAACPPQGIIDKSVLEFGALMSFFAVIAVAREAIKEGKGAKITHGQTEININSKEQ